MKRALIAALCDLTEQQATHVYDALTDWLEQQQEAIASVDDVPAHWKDRAVAVEALTAAGDASRAARASDADTATLQRRYLLDSGGWS